jgi:hypothetical protein
MLPQRLGGPRIIFTDAERRQLAEKRRVLGRTLTLSVNTAVYSHLDRANRRVGIRKAE